MTSGDACPTREEIIQKTRSLQMPFIANSGQVNEQVRFYAKTFGGTVFVTNEGAIVYALPGFGKASNYRSNGSNGSNRLSGLNSSISSTRAIALKETIVGAKIAGITGEQPAITKVNYFTGNNRSKWKANVPTYNMVNMGEVCKGIELHLKAYGDNVEKLFCVKPGASPAFIKVQLDGSKSLLVNQEGQLEADTGLGVVKFTRPIAYQEIEGKRVDVAVEYCIHVAGIDGAECSGAGVSGGSGASEIQNPKPETKNSKRTYGFAVASYDKTKDLIIDPLLASTFLGGSDSESGKSLAIDTSGNVYVMGVTVSANFPTTVGVYDTSLNGYAKDVFVSMLDSKLTSLLVSTYLGGSRSDDGYSIALDKSGNVYVAGTTYSADFPTTSGVYDTSFNGDDDVFVTMLDPKLTSLLASTYLGGVSSDDGYSLSIDTNGNVYVTGETGSKNFPTTVGVYDTSFNGGYYDAFVSMLDPKLTSLLASTYLGGTNRDDGYSIAIDKSGNVYVTGATRSKNFPTTVGVYDTTFNGGDLDVFVSMLDPKLTSLLASTYLGGIFSDYGISLAIGKSESVYVTGVTRSKNFPTTIGAHDTFFNGGYYDAFVSMLDSKLTNLQASTYLGGAYRDDGNALALDASGNVYVTGVTRSKNFPTTIGAHDTSFNGGYYDAFVSKLDPKLSGMLASTYLGGVNRDDGYAIALDTSGNVYVTGATRSKDFPTTTGVYDTVFNGGDLDVFISNLDGNLSVK